MTQRVLVVGGTGGFGHRLVYGLAATTDFEIIVAARDFGRARAVAEKIGATHPRAAASAVYLDAASVTAELLRELGAFAVADAAGPFQGANYRLGRAAIEAGMHYVDLADARDFVAGFTALDGLAREAGVVAVTGASSTPGLSTAALDVLTIGWRQVDAVETAIAAGNRVGPLGVSVFHSILSYAGKPVRVFNGGRWVSRAGWGMTTRRDMPGIGRRWLSLCETPDLDIAVARFAVTDSALFRAGLELPLLHLGMVGASLLVRIGLMRSLLPLLPVFRRVAMAAARFGSDCGGMTVEACGIDADGAPVRSRWALIADAGDGPFVPTLPALAVLRALSEGRLHRPGAWLCADAIDLPLIEREFAPYRIAARIETLRPVSPFCSLLGDDAVAQLPAPVARLHSLKCRVETAGRADIATAPGVLPWLICRLMGLPSPGRSVPVTVSFEPDAAGGERWRRRFAERRYASTLRRGDGRRAGFLVERFGPFTLYFRLTPRPDGLGWRLVGWRLFAVPLPRWAMPRFAYLESGDGERFVFDIDMRMPLIGQIIRYRGWLLPERSAAPPDAVSRGVGPARNDARPSR